MCSKTIFLGTFNLRCKGIKKAVKILSVFVLIIVGMVVLVWSALRSPLIQTMLANQITAVLSRTLGTDVSVKKARYYIRQGLTLQDVLIRCPNGDTLLYVPQLSGYLRSISANERQIGIQRAYIRGVQANIVRTDSVFNFSFLLESFNKPDTAGSPWKVGVDEFTLVQTNVSFNDNGKQHRFNDISIDISDFSLGGDTISARLESMSTGYNGVAEIGNFELDFMMSGKTIAVNNLKFNSQNSSAAIGNLNLTVGQPLQYTAAIDNLRLCPTDFAQFVPIFEGNDQCVTLKGRFGGTAEKLRGRQVQLMFGDSSLLSTDFAVRDIQNIDSLNYNLTVSKLHTTSRELCNLLGAYTKIDTAKLAGNIGPLGAIVFAGQAEGSLSNITASGQLGTGIGSLNLQANVDKVGSQAYDVSGWLKSTPLALDSYIGNKATLRTDLQVNGFIGGSATNINVNGMVNDIRYSNVDIDSITINGRFANKMFSGNLSSFDPNLRFDFDGLVNVGDSQTYNFRSCVYYANLSALGLVSDSLANLSFNMNADFCGPSVDQADGTIEITDLYYFRDSTYLATDTVLIAAANSDTGRVVTLTSEFVNASACGNFNLARMAKNVGRFVNSFLTDEPYEPSETHNSIGLDVVIDYPHPLTAMYAPWLSIASGTRVTAEFDDSTAAFSMNFMSGNITVRSIEVENIGLEMHNKGNQMIAGLTSDALYFSDYESMKNIRATGQLASSVSDLNINWNNLLDKGNNSGNVNVELAFGGNGERLRVGIRPSWISILDDTATISPASITLRDTAVVIEHIEIGNNASRLYADGVLSDYPDDSLTVDINNVKLEFLSDIFALKTRFAGTLSCQSTMKDLKGEKRIDGDLSIGNFAIDGQRFGNINADAAWDMEQRRLLVGGTLSDAGGSKTTFGGYIDPSAFYMDLDAEATHQDVQFLKLFLSGVFSELAGTFSGKMHLEGRLNSPKWYGKLGLENAQLTVRPTKATYIVNDTLEFSENRILFNNILGSDGENGTARLNGSIWHRNFKEFNLDLKINCDNVIALNTRATDSPLWYGKTYASGIVDITGSNRKTVDIDISATTMPKSMFYITMEGRNDLTENDFITFVSTKNVKNINDMKKSRREVAIAAPRSVLNLNLDLKVTPDAEIQIVFDPTIGDALRSNGSADLNIRLDDGKFSIYGTYLISSGNFTFTLQNVISKKLDLQSGSYLTWTGEPLGATINIDAAYKLRKVPVYSLTLNEEDREKRVPVNCHLLMTNKLVSPNIGFSIDVPANTTYVEEIEQLNSLPEDDLNQQVIYLLLFNKFYPLTSASESSAGTTAANLGASTASELLSNQLSKWISQVSTNFDLGVAYRPETEISSEEYELALSTSLWDDRITVSSNFDVNNQDKSAENSTQYTTDFSVELKLNKKGNVRLKAFQKASDDLIYDDSPYTRGLGVFYTEDFNDFGELWRRWFRRKRVAKPVTYDAVGETSEPANSGGL